MQAFENVFPCSNASFDKNFADNYGILLLEALLIKFPL